MIRHDDVLDVVLGRLAHRGHERRELVPVAVVRRDGKILREEMMAQLPALGAEAVPAGKVIPDEGREKVRNHGVGLVRSSTFHLVPDHLGAAHRVDADHERSRNRTGGENIEDDEQKDHKAAQEDGHAPEPAGRMQDLTTKVGELRSLDVVRHSLNLRGEKRSRRAPGAGANEV